MLNIENRPKKQNNILLILFWILVGIASLIFDINFSYSADPNFDNNITTACDSDFISKEFLISVNNERYRYNKPPLKLDNQVLQTQCDAWCYHMAETNRMVHSGYNCGENIAEGQNSVKEVMTDWMNSPGHKANILGNYHSIALSCYQSSNGTKYWCQEFK